MGSPLSIILASVIIIMFLLFMIHQEVLFGRMIKQNEKVMRSSNDRLTTLVEQNNALLVHADQRLDRANEMVLKLAHSADLLSESIKALKDMAVQRAESYDIESKTLIASREEYKDAYTKLLVQFEEQRKRLRELADEDHRALKELAGRPTMNTTNNNM